MRHNTIKGPYPPQRDYITKRRGRNNEGSPLRTPDSLHGNNVSSTVVKWCTQARSDSTGFKSNYAWAHYRLSLHSNTCRGSSEHALELFETLDTLMCQLCRDEQLWVSLRSQLLECVFVDPQNPRQTFVEAAKRLSCSVEGLSVKLDYHGAVLGRLRESVKRRCEASHGDLLRRSFDALREHTRAETARRCRTEAILKWRNEKMLKNAKFNWWRKVTLFAKLRAAGRLTRRPITPGFEVHEQRDQDAIELNHQLQSERILRDRQFTALTNDIQVLTNDMAALQKRLTVVHVQKALWRSLWLTHHRDCSLPLAEPQHLQHLTHRLITYQSPSDVESVLVAWSNFMLSYRESHIEKEGIRRSVHVRVITTLSDVLSNHLEGIAEVVCSARDIRQDASEVPTTAITALIERAERSFGGASMLWSKLTGRDGCDVGTLAQVARGTLSGSYTQNESLIVLLFHEFCVQHDLEPLGLDQSLQSSEGADVYGHLRLYREAADEGAPLSPVDYVVGDFDAGVGAVHPPFVEFNELFESARFEGLVSGSYDPVLLNKFYIETNHRRRMWDTTFRAVERSMCIYL